MHPICWGGGGEVEPPTKFPKKMGGDLTGPQFLEGVARKEGGNLFQGGLQCLHKNELKSETFNNKTVYKQNCFSLFNNSNWQILTKNLVAFKR